MLQRILAVSFNTYREAVRARILHGLFGLAVLTLGYSLVVGAYALHNSNRVIADLGASTISAYSIVVAIVLSATSLYRELDLKTIYPILARPIGRGEYLVGKFLGILLTLLVFVAGNSGLLLVAIGLGEGPSAARGTLPLVGFLIGLTVAIWRLPRFRTLLPVPASLVMLGVGAFIAEPLVSESRVVVGQAVFTALEVCIVSALALLFASFSTPFLTAVFSLCTVIVGRSADTLAALPIKMFGPLIHDVGVGFSWVFPDLMVYVPTRAFLTGEAIGVPFTQHLSLAVVQALGWVVLLLGGAVAIFRRRDFL
jgi:Cu-processing system permease protein